MNSTAGGPFGCAAVDGSLCRHRGLWGLAAAFALLVGYGFATAGYRFFRVTAVLATFTAAFAAAAPPLMVATGPDAVERWVPAAAALAAGFAALARACLRAASWVLGAAAGAAAVLRLWTVVPMDLGTGMAVVGAFACFCGQLLWSGVSRPLLVLSTAAYGVLMCLAGLQMLMGVARGQSVCAHSEAYAAAAAALVPLAAILQLTESPEPRETDGAYGPVPPEEEEEELIRYA